MTFEAIDIQQTNGAQIVAWFMEWNIALLYHAVERRA